MLYPGFLCEVKELIFSTKNITECCNDGPNCLTYCQRDYSCRVNERGKLYGNLYPCVSLVSLCSLDPRLTHRAKGQDRNR